ncbi:MAG: ribosome biogenesis GTP-binding protein YihA/YsxC [Clostridiales bacterium]|nr:ribosome biogenesis GTP-binding protein YihA/YsxC [Clostridiales bacterium]
MIIKKADIFALAVGPAQYPGSGAPEIALAGRSNVGKSSLINTFLNRKNLARTSSTPGKTRTINFYGVNDEWFFVDLPGYGYAKISKEERAKWGKFIESYLTDRKELAGIIQLVDLRHPPMESDKTMVEWLTHYQIPILVAGTKADKLSRGQWAKQLKQARQVLGLSAQTPAIAFSAVTGQGKEELGEWLEGRLALPAG